MGLFHHKPIQGSISPMGRGPPVHRSREAHEEVDDEEPDAPKKVYDKEKAPKKEKKKDVPETETDKNTRLNALLFDTSEESVNMYRSENSSSEVLGRLYFDDYDSDASSSVVSPSPLAPVSNERQNAFLTVQSAAQRLRSPSPAKRPAFSRQSSFERGVSFDTLDDKHHKAITLKLRHPQFHFRRNNKTYLVGFNNDVESLRAIEWAFQEMVINGDTLIVLQVLDEKIYKQVDSQLGEQVLAKIEKLNIHNKKISLVYEAVIGKPQKLLRGAIDEYKPAMMIVGTHNYEKAQLKHSNSSQNIIDSSHPTHGPQPHKHRGFLSKASTSKYFLQFALVPCIVVKPIYHYVEQQEKPIETETYFHDWLANIDISHTYEKEKKKRFAMFSPSQSRNGSSTNLADMDKDRSRNLDASFHFGCRSPSPVPDPEHKSRLSRFFHH